jgi:O-antigen/teichoic acid export membrane protein
VLQVSGYGTFAYASTWLGVLIIPSTLGLDQVLLRYVAAYNETCNWPALKGLLRFALAIGFTGSVSVSLISITVVAQFATRNGDLRATLCITLGLLPIVVLAQLRQASLRGFHRPGAAQVPENIAFPILVILGALAAYAIRGPKLTVPEVAAVNGAAWVLTFVIGTVLMLRALPKPVRYCRPTYSLPEWLAMLPSLLLGLGAYQILSRADMLILGALGTKHDVGLYAVASRSSELMLFVYDAITLAGVSLFSSIYATGDLQELQLFTRLMARIILCASLPIYAIAMIFAPWFLRVFGTEFTAGADVMRFLVTSLFLSTLGGFGNLMLSMAGRQRDVAITMCFVAAFSVVLSVLMIPRFGRMGAAIASGTSQILLNGILGFVLYKRIGIISLPFRARGSP